MKTSSRKASDVTTAAVSLVVGAGRAGDFPAIARALVAKLATASGRTSPSSLRRGPPRIESRLAASLKQATGKDVDVRVTVDPSVLGGIVTTIGDTVIDGSVRSRAQVQAISADLSLQRFTAHQNPHQRE